jgi:hypothetical protein
MFLQVANIGQRCLIFSARKKDDNYVNLKLAKLSPHNDVIVAL